MALINLVRLTTVAGLLGCRPATCRKWCEGAQVQLIRRPVVRWGQTQTGANSPWYVSLEGAIRLVDTMLPARLERAANARARKQLQRAAHALEESTANLVHEDGRGTPSDSTPLKPAQ